MGWMDQIGAILKQYTTSGGAAAQPAVDVNAHFDQVAQAAPPSALADGLAAAFRSDKTPAMGQMVANLFSQSSGEQKAGLLNQLMAHVDPATLTQILSGTAVSGLTALLSGGAPSLTAAQAQQVPPEVVKQIATHAEKTNPSVIDSLSNFYAQHSTLVKTLGSAALSIVMAKMAERQR